MTDIVERLRNKLYLSGDLTIDEIDAERAEAADEIERLRASIDAARSGLLRIEQQAEETRAIVTRHIWNGKIGK